MKKKIAIVTKKMILGGIEKALLSMISEMANGIVFLSGWRRAVI